MFNDMFSSWQLGNRWYNDVWMMIIKYIDGYLKMKWNQSDACSVEIGVRVPYLHGCAREGPIQAYASTY